MEMELREFGLVAGVALIVGVLGQLTSRYSRGGWALSFGMALIGGVLGLWVARGLTLPIILPLTIARTEFPVLYVMLGSVFAIGIAGFFTRIR